MYHDEFAKQPAKPMSRRVAPRPDGDIDFPSLPLEVGGGLSLGLAVSLNQPVSLLLIDLGGLLPLVSCCLGIAARRASEFLAGLFPSSGASRPSAVPVPHLVGSPGAAARARFRHQRAKAGR